MSTPCPPAQANCANVSVGEIVANGKGAKTAPLTPAIRLTLSNVGTPFQVSAYDGQSSRKSFDLRSTPEIRAFCERLDTKLKQQAAKLGCKAENYSSLLKQQRDFDALLRTKVTISDTGKSGTKFFEHGTKRRLTDEEVATLDWRDCTYNVLLRISSVWLNGGNYGPIASPEAVVVKREDMFPEGLAFEDLALLYQ